MSGTLIKGTIQVQDTNSAVAHNTGILVMSPTYVSQIKTTVFPSSTSFNDVANQVDSYLNGVLGAETLIDVQYIHQGTDFWGIVTTYVLI